MAKFPGLTKRGGRYVLRTFVPKDIIQSFGKREIVTALGTADVNEAVKRAKTKAADFVRHFEDHRRAAPQKAKGAPSVTDAIDIPRLAASLSQAHYVAVKERDVVDRSELFEQVSSNYDAFFRGEIKELPDTEYWEQLIVGDPDLPLTSVLSFCWWHWHGERIAELKGAIKGGDLAGHVAIVETMLGSQKTTKVQRLVLAKAIMQAEIEAQRPSESCCPRVMRVAS